MISRKNYFIILIIIIPTFILWYDKIDISDHINADANKYLAMAKDEHHTVMSPFGYRFLGPKIVSGLPFQPEMGFRIVMVFTVFLIIIALYELLVMLKLHHDEILLVIILFLGNKYLTGFLIWNYYQIPDLLGFLALILLFITLLKQNWLLFGIIFIIGILSRETPLIIIPSAIIFLISKRSTISEWGLFFVSITPAISLLLFLRLFIPMPIEQSLFNQFIDGGDKWFSSIVWFRTIINAWIPIAFLPWIFSAITVEYFKKYPFLMVLIPTTLFSASFGNDNERLLLPLALAIYPLVGTILTEYKSKTMRTLVILGIVISLPHHFIGFVNTPNNVWSLGFSITGLIVVSFTGLMVKKNKPISI